MKSKGKSQRRDDWPPDVDAVTSDEWFARYLLNAVLLAVLMLTAIAVALYLDGGQYLHDRGQEPGAAFLTCLLLCPMLGVVALGLVVYAGIRLFLRPHTLGHASVRLALLVAHACVFFVCVDTILSTATAVIRSAGPSSAGTDPTEAMRAIANRDFSGSQGGERNGPPDGSSFSPPSSMGVPGFWTPGGGTGSR
jgi:hypothetical protein